MHACEAMLAAFEATGEARYLLRAETLAHNITVRQALADGMMWEHYTPTGRSTGTTTARQEQYLPSMGLPARPPDRMGQAAAAAGAPRRFMANNPTGCCRARAHCTTRRWPRPGTAAWRHPLRLRPDGSICDGDKYFWVQAESLAAAAVLAARTGEDAYWTWYDKIWDYSWSISSTTSTAPGTASSRPTTEADRREKPGRQGRLPHHGRLLRSAERIEGAA
jgi:hypothetical protein